MWRGQALENSSIAKAEPLKNWMWKVVRLLYSVKDVDLEQLRSTAQTQESVQKKTGGIESHEGNSHPLFTSVRCSLCISLHLEIANPTHPLIL